MLSLGSPASLASPASSSWSKLGEDSKVTHTYITVYLEVSQEMGEVLPPASCCSLFYFPLAVPVKITITSKEKISVTCSGREPGSSAGRPSPLPSPCLPGPGAGR